MADDPAAKERLLAIDQGTHASRALLVDHRGSARVVATAEVVLHRQDGGRVEQDAFELLDSVRDVVGAALAWAKREGLRIIRAGLATQRSTVVAWDARDGRPLYPALSWQDTRGKAQLRRFAAEAGEVEAKTGLRLSPHYGASKLRWLVEEVEAVGRAARGHRLRMGPLAAFLLHHLLEEAPHRCDVVNASRTLLVDLRVRNWDASLIHAAGLEREWLPECRPVIDDYGVLRGTTIPISAVNGDQNAALCADGRPGAEALRVNAGTGAFIAAPVESMADSPAPLLGSILWSDDGAAHYLLEGTVNGAGAALKWAESREGLPPAESVLANWPECPEGPPLFLNTVGGLGSPWWRSGIPPRWLEEAGTFDASCRIAGVAESILFLIGANVDLVRERVPSTRFIILSGGLAKGDGWCQRLADLTGMEVRRSAAAEATGRGIAWLAAGRPDDWRAAGADRFTATPDPALERRYTRFIRALELALTQ
ncbi:MAG: glycerol kinase GlpK [Gammaproteobacteria bacterium]